MIHSIRLLHWKSHEKTEIRFSRGTNVLVGPMGAGKTSVMDGLCFALYGTFPALKSKRVKLEEVVMQRPEKYGEAKVEAAIEVGGKKYAIERTVNSNGSKAFLMHEGKLLETGPVRVNEAVEKLLKTDYELFSRAIYAEQNNIDAFLTLGRGERKTQIDELLGLDKFEKARAGAASAANKLKSMKGEVEAGLRGTDEKLLREEIAGLQNELAQTQAEQERLGKQIGDLDAELSRKKTREGTLEEKRSAHAALSTQLAGENAKLESVGESASRIKSQLKKTRPREGIEAEANKAAAELAALEEMEKRLFDLTSRHEKTAGELSGLEPRIENLGKRTQGRKPEEIAWLLSEARRAAGELEKREQALSAGQVELKAGLSVLQRLSGEMAAREKKASEIQDRLIKYSALLKQAGQLEQLERKKAELEESEKRLGARVLELREAIRKLEASDAVCGVCESPLPMEKAVALLEKKKATLGNCEQEMKAVEEKLVAAEADVGKRAKLEAESAAFAGELAGEKAEVEKIRKQSEELPYFEREVEKKSRELAATKALLEEARQKQESLLQAASAVQELEECLKRKATLDEEKRKTGAELEKLREKYSPQAKKQLEQELAEINKNIELLSLEARLSEVSRKTAELENKLRGISFNPQELSQARLEALESEKRLVEAKLGLESGRKMFLEKKAREKELNERRWAWEKQAARLGELERGISVLSKFQNAVSQAQAMLRSELVQSVNEAAGFLWKSIYPYSDFQSIKLNASEQDYIVELLTNTGEWTSVERASGGERTCASLALRISFAMVLTPNLSWIVLDEPTHNLDAHAINSFCRTLRDEIPKIVEQVFIVTHDEALKEGANAAVYKIERDKDGGDKSTVELLSSA